MRVVKVHEAKTQFSKLLAEVEQGEEIIVQRGDVPVAKLVPIPPVAERKLGAYTGQIWMADDFDELGPEWDEYMR
ncbi:MAG: type II toxin-antitoxin system Phd/YefM family antitoxin [Patulibacter minatonensis]